MVENRHFRHEPLSHDEDSLRLIKIEPELSKQGQIQLSLLHYTVREQRYSCLSYMWGNDSKTYTVLINGQPYSVRQNLWSFLEFARRYIAKHDCIKVPPPTSRGVSTYSISHPLFWIDAICINQNDTVEKNHQVQQMSAIYRSAILVLVWLDGDDERFVQKIWFGQYGIHKEEALAWLREHRYWSRAWITQEVVLARWPFICVESGIYNLRSIFRFHAEDSDRRAKLQSPAAGVESSFELLSSFITEGSQTSVRQSNLFHALHTFGTTKQCANILDRIYSLLGLAPNNTVVVDYAVSPPHLWGDLIASSGGQVCFCGISIAAKALEVSSAPQDRGSDMAIEIQLRKATCVDPRGAIDSMCYRCARILPTDFHQPGGHYFCLSEVCESMHGHIFAYGGHAESSEQDAAYQHRNTNGLYAPDESSASGITGIEVVSGNAPVKYQTVIWRFSLNALAALAEIKNGEHEDGVVPLCRKARYIVDIGSVAAVGRLRACSTVGLA